MKNRLFGSVLMILGTSIGAAMLALPVASAKQNLLMTFGLMLASWLLMTLGALAILEVNCWLSPGTNLISMAEKTLGFWGKVTAWVIYLFLLYSLLCAYLTGIGGVLHALLQELHIVLSFWLVVVFALMGLGLIVYQGVRAVDGVNRLLMGAKLIVYVVLVVTIIGHVQFHHLMVGGYQLHMSAVMVMMTSFGYAIIVPSLRVYLHSDIKKLKKAVVIGSLLPFLVYLLWIVVVQGLLPRVELWQIANAKHTTARLMTAVSAHIHLQWLKGVAKIFMAVCVITSFLGVSLCLTDFMADGLGVKKSGKSSFLVYGFTFLPPLFIVLLAPGIFIQALSYAGIFCVLLLILLPLLMLYRGRYCQTGLTGTVIVPGKRAVLIIGLVFGLLLLVGSVVLRLH